MLRSLTSDYKPETLGINLYLPQNIQDKGTGPMNASLVCEYFSQKNVVAWGLMG